MEGNETVTHLRVMTHKPIAAQGGLDFVESLVLLLFNIGFQGWDNAPSVLRNLQKFYSKT